MTGRSTNHSVITSPASRFLRRRTYFSSSKCKRTALSTHHSVEPPLSMVIRLGDEEFGLTFSRIIGEMTGDEVFKAKHSGLIKAYDARTLTVGAITLTEVAEMKIICDGYFVRLFGR